MSSRKVAHAAVAVTVVVWGLSNVLIKLTTLRGLAMSFWRLWVGVAIMVVAALVSGRRLTWPVLRVAAPAGVLFGLTVVFGFSAVKLTSVADATLISALQPMLVIVVAGRWFGEKVTLRDAAWTTLAIVGVAIVVLGSSQTAVWSAFGDLLAFGSLLTFTGYFLVSKHVRMRVDPLAYLTAAIGVAALTVTPIALLSGTDLRVRRTTDWVLIVVVALVPGAAGHFVINWAHRYVAVWISSLMIAGTPVAAAVGALVVLGEPLRPLQIAGGVVVLASIVRVIIRHPLKPEETPELAASETHPV